METALLSACELLAADLQAGLTPETALARAAADWPALGVAAVAADLGGDVPEALRRLAVDCDLPDLRYVAGTWQVALRSGGPLAPRLAGAARRLRQGQALRALVDAELSSARATARLLAGLPAVALFMGSGVGGDPLMFLLATPVGVCCLVAGVTLELVGLWWIGRISDAVAGST